MRRVLVTGGGGFVGSHIVRQLLAQDIQCLVLGRNRYPEMEALGAKTCQGDICDAAFLHKCCKDVDTVFHVAALAGIWGDWDDYYRVNILGTENVLAACRENRVPRLVYTSTPSVVFNGEDIENGDETLPYADHFLCHYAKSKVIAEKLILEASCKELLTCAIRPHLVWGPGDPHLIPRLLERGRKKQLKQVGDGTNLVDISYVENVAEAHLLAALNLETSGTAAGNAYFISQGEPVNLWQWINELFAAMDVPKVESRVSFRLAYFAGTVLEGLYRLARKQQEPKMTRFLAEQLAKSHYFSNDKAKTDFGYSPRVDTSGGMKRMLHVLKQEQ